MSTIVQIIKFLLILFSVYFVYLQKDQDKRSIFYWSLVGFYWFFNFLSGFKWKY